MKSFAVLSILASLAALSSAQSTLSGTARLDQTYDNPQGSINSAACSNQLTQRFGWTTFGQIPTFPNIGGSRAISDFSSPECGSCWEIVDTDTGATVYFTAISTAGDGVFNVGANTMETLGGDAGVQHGSVPVTGTQVDPSFCGLA